MGSNKPQSSQGTGGYFTGQRYITSRSVRTDPHRLPAKVSTISDAYRCKDTAQNCHDVGGISTQSTPGVCSLSDGKQTKSLPMAPLRGMHGPRLEQSSDRQQGH